MEIDNRIPEDDTVVERLAYARLAGADGYISKRSGFQKVLERIGEVLGR